MKPLRRLAAALCLAFAALEPAKADTVTGSFGIIDTANGVDSTYVFDIGGPLTISGEVDVVASFTVTLVDLGQGGATLDGLTGNGNQWLFTGRTGPSLTSLSVDLGDGCTVARDDPDGQETCTFSASGVSFLTPGDTELRTRMAGVFSDGDRIDIQFSLTVTPRYVALPAPAGGALAAIALAGLGFAGRQRRRS